MKQTLAMDSPFSSNRRLRACAVTIALVLLAAACGDDSDDEDSSPDTTAPATSETTAPDEQSDDTAEPDDDEELTPEEEVLADYEAAREARAAAFAVPDPEHPEMLDHWSGEALTHLQASITNLQLEGQAAEGEGESHPVVELDPENENQAWVVDCFIDRSQLIDAETREPVSGTGETIAETRERLELIDGTWVVVENEYLEEDACTPGDD